MVSHFESDIQLDGRYPGLQTLPCPRRKQVILCHYCAEAMLGFLLPAVCNSDYEVYLEGEWSEEKGSTDCAQDVVASPARHKDAESHG